MMWAKVVFIPISAETLDLHQHCYHNANAVQLNQECKEFTCDWTHPAQPHVVVALLQLQRLQQLLHRLECSRANSQHAHKQKQTMRQFQGGPKLEQLRYLEDACPATIATSAIQPEHSKQFRSASRGRKGQSESRVTGWQGFFLSASANYTTSRCQDKLQIV